MNRTRLSAVTISFCTSVFCLGQVVSYDCMNLPEAANPPWSRDTRLYPPLRWVEDGWFVQKTSVATWNPYEPQDDFYRRSIVEFAGIPAFFVEWRVQTDGSRDGIPSVAPTVISTTGTMGVFYYFVISRDLVRYIDTAAYPHPFDIAPDVPHSYRVEIREQAYKVFIDAQQVYAATTPRSYPGPDSYIVFGARAPGDPDPTTTRWDYIRYGALRSGQPGDMDCDGSVNQFDIQGFVDAMQSRVGYWQAYPDCSPMNADTNGDGSINQFDIQPFVGLLVH